ncbi:LexA family transcriptional regulator [Chromobacterium sp. IIBBL 290-4]|uniref:LexA family protein n=1 Tax=Chromobacterium sp. IIBBL 290-4 TaxID=2953890 RepID=UPI0020B8E63D|nr:translesion error-prone DNA polymerase V autoproteolytic subunit [Chromobacterium sp. IIBBL 290-4]UTH73278.1 translesion error-prone DNA polymerase V autoproteolytic subunit [Chromobacterium sp. IIBBL 290-4]
MLHPARLLPPHQSQTLPLVDASVRAGFPSPAEGYAHEPIDLYAHLVQDPQATFMVRVAGDSMSGAGIDEGDLLIVDKGLTPLHGDIVVAAVDGEFTVKRLRMERGWHALQAENPAYPTLYPAEGQEWLIWGVVTACVKKFR